MIHAIDTIGKLLSLLLIKISFIVSADMKLLLHLLLHSIGDSMAHTCWGQFFWRKLEKILNFSFECLHLPTYCWLFPFAPPPFLKLFDPLSNQSPAKKYPVFILCLLCARYVKVRWNSRHGNKFCHKVFLKTTFFYANSYSFTPLITEIPRTSYITFPFINITFVALQVHTEIKSSILECLVWLV